MTDEERWALESLEKIATWVTDEVVPALIHWSKDGSVSSVVCGHGDSCDAIKFYDGLKIKPEDLLKRFNELMTPYQPIQEPPPL